MSRRHHEWKLRHPKTDDQAETLVVAGPKRQWDAVLAVLDAIGSKETTNLADWIREEIDRFRSA